MLRPGSTLWLLAHELRLWRRRFGGRMAGGKAALWISVGGVMILTFAAGVPLGLFLRGVEIAVTPGAVIVSLAALVMVFTLMLSQTLDASTEALYQRADLDLLFSSPLDPRKVLTVRFLAVALQVFAGFSAFIAPFLLPVAILGHWRWLGGFVVLASLALATTALGLALAMALFAVIGPRRTRTVAQVMAAMIGAGLFLALQARNLLGGARTGSVVNDLMRVASDPGLHPPPLADLPLRAAMGEPGPLAAVAVLAIAAFGWTSRSLGRRFAADAAAASGA